MTFPSPSVSFSAAEECGERGVQNGKCGKRRVRQPAAEPFEYGDWGAVYGVSEAKEYVEAGA